MGHEVRPGRISLRCHRVLRSIALVVRYCDGLRTIADLARRVGRLYNNQINAAVAVAAALGTQPQGTQSNVLSVRREVA
jgi:hypothetical protein